jgi:putative sterol carrier protein
MTSTVKVTAHCATNKEVVISIDEGATGSTVYLQDGESHEVCVYDEKSVSVKERVKE